MITDIRKGLLFASALASAALLVLPARAEAGTPARDFMAVTASNETPLMAAAAPAAFAEASRAQGEALFGATSFSSSVEVPVVIAAVDSLPEDSLPEAPLPRTAVPLSWESGSAMLPSTIDCGKQSRHSLTVEAGCPAPGWTAGDKLIASLQNLYNPASVAGTVIAAGYSHLTNSSPNYGTDGDAFAQRFGAGMARSASQNIFTNGILAPVFHEDPRYYVLGDDHKFVARILYAATRPFITRTDGGHSTINAAMLIGYAGAAALTRVYYPPINRNFHDIASTYGSSLGGAAIGFGFSEFYGDIRKALPFLPN